MLEKCETPIWKKCAYTVCALSIVISILITTGSDAYHECYNREESSQAAYASNPSENFLDTTWWWWKCQWFSINENEGIVVGLFTALLVGVTFFLWKETQRVAEDSDKTSRQQLRGYVAVIFDAPGWQEDGVRPDGKRSGRLAIRIKNLGLTPVTITDFTTKKIYSEFLTVPEYRPRNVGINHLLSPQQDYVEYCRLNVRGKTDAFIIGYIDYIDVFGSRWRTGYARRYKAERDSFDAETNVVPVSTPGFNYDRPRVKGEGNDWN